MFRLAPPATGATKQLSQAENVELRRRYRQFGLAVGMLISGTANTLTCKQAFSAVSDRHVFNHPFVQAGAMFMGEIGCMAYYVTSCWWRGRHVHWPTLTVFLSFALPAACDIVGTSTMYVGLTMTSASTYQMLRGSVVIFTGLMSRLMLQRLTHLHQWCGMVLVFLGALVVGSTSVLQPDAPAEAATPSSNALLGDLLVVFSQLFTSLQARRARFQPVCLLLLLGVLHHRPHSPATAASTACPAADGPGGALRHRPSHARPRRCGLRGGVGLGRWLSRAVHPPV